MVKGISWEMFLFAFTKRETEWGRFESYIPVCVYKKRHLNSTNKMGFIPTRVYTLQLKT